MPIANLLCPQCQSSTPQLSSEILAVQPISGADNCLYYWDSSGVCQLSSQPYIGFVCSNNHFWYGLRPEGL